MSNLRKHFEKNHIFLLFQIMFVLLIHNVTYGEMVIGGVLNETRMTPEGRIGTAYDYQLSVTKTARAYASVNKEDLLGGARVNTYAYISADEFVDKDDDTEFSDGTYHLDIDYCDQEQNGEIPGFHR